MKIVVTGGCGKAGRPLVEELGSDGNGKARHEVLVFDKAPAQARGRVRFLRGDILDFGQVYSALAGADAAIHLAGIHTHGIVSNEETFRINAMGTFNVHEAAWRLGIRRVVTMSSEAVLGWAPGSWEREHVPAYLPIDEDHPVGAQDAYGLSKLACEAIARSYAARSGMETVILRPPWIVSPEELDGLRQVGGVAPARFGLYHYIDSRDLAAACRAAIERPLTGTHTLFVGSGETTVAEPLSTLYPRLMPAIGDKAEALTGVRGPVSTERARSLLDWAPRYSWRDRCDAREGQVRAR